MPFLIVANEERNLIGCLHKEKSYALSNFRIKVDDRLSAVKRGETAVQCCITAEIKGWPTHITERQICTIYCAYLK
jgi:hypothetical protein